MNRCSVAQVANLLYRRLLIGEALGRQTASGLATRDTAQRGQAATKTELPKLQRHADAVALQKNRREVRRFSEILIDTAVCATAEAQHGAVPEAGAPDRSGSWAQCAAKMTSRLSINRSAELQLGAAKRA